MKIGGSERFERTFSGWEKEDRRIFMFRWTLWSRNPGMPPHTGVFRGNDSCANVIRIDVLARQQRSVSNLPSRRKVAQRNIGFARGRGSSRYTNVHTEGSSSIGATNWKRASFSHPSPLRVFFTCATTLLFQARQLRADRFCFVCLEISR